MTFWKDMPAQQAKDARTMFQLAKSLSKANRRKDTIDPIIYIMGKWRYQNGYAGRVKNK